MKIGYLYYKFYPVDGGAAIHGYHLAKELSQVGYELFKLNGKKDPYTKKFSNPVYGFIWMLIYCDLVYVRMDYFIKPRNILAVLAIIFRKKIIVELNSPSDELHLFNRSQKYISVVDSIMAFILKHVNAIIVVSEPIKQYCKVQLGLENVIVVENGADLFKIDSSNVCPEVRSEIKKIKSQYEKLIVWSGSVNKLQDMNLFNEIIQSSPKENAFILILKMEEGIEWPIKDSDNIHISTNLKRTDVEYIISQSDAGIALYGDYDWCRWGFYNSSLKVFEYLSNSLVTISNKPGTELQRRNPNYYFGKDFKEILFLINNLPIAHQQTDFRSWVDVANDIDQIIRLIDKN